MSQWDQGIDDMTPPCNADRWVSSFESDEDDHHDDHQDDHHEESSAWEFIFPDEVFIDSINPYPRILEKKSKNRELS